jgi:hypothetical protein
MERREKYENIPEVEQENFGTWMWRERLGGEDWSVLRFEDSLIRINTEK